MVCGLGFGVLSLGLGFERFASVVQGSGFSKLRNKVLRVLGFGFRCSGFG